MPKTVKTTLKKLFKRVRNRSNDNFLIFPQVSMAHLNKVDIHNLIYWRENDLLDKRTLEAPLIAWSPGSWFIWLCHTGHIEDALQGVPLSETAKDVFRYFYRDFHREDHFSIGVRFSIDADPIPHLLQALWSEEDWRNMETACFFKEVVRR